MEPWRSVVDVLPSPDVEVLVVTRDGDRLIGSVDDEGLWLETQYGDEIDRVTHWTYLPAGPAKGE